MPVFCYPYGLASDYSVDAQEAARKAGMVAAVTACPGYVATGHGAAVSRFALPRFALPSTLVDMKQVVFGFERLKTILRGSA